MATTADKKAAKSQTAAEARVRSIATNRGYTLTPAQVRSYAKLGMRTGDFDPVRARVDALKSPGKPGSTTPRDPVTTEPYPKDGRQSSPWLPGGGGGGGTDAPPAEEVTVDFYAQAKALFPWLPTSLLRAYADGWASSNDPQVAWGYVRQSKQYDQFFAGNRRDDGTFRMTEMEYMATKDGYRQTMRDYGLNAAMFEDKHVSLITGDVSLAEFQNRMEEVQTRLVNNTPDVQAFFQQNYGVAYTSAIMDTAPEVAFAMVMDPNVGRALLDRRLSISSIGGEAASRGFARSASESERLVSAGINQGQARQLYSQAAEQLPTLDALAKRFRDADQDFGLSEFEDMAALGDTGQQQRARRLVGAEQSSFSGQQGRVERDPTGGLAGLRQR